MTNPVFKLVFISSYNAAHINLFQYSAIKDFPVVLTGDEAAKVGFTSIPMDICFSPVKNATSDGVALQEKGTAAGVATTCKADQYDAVVKIVQLAQEIVKKIFRICCVIL